MFNFSRRALVPLAIASLASVFVVSNGTAASAETTVAQSVRCVDDHQFLDVTITNTEDYGIYYDVRFDELQVSEGFLVGPGQEKVLTVTPLQGYDQLIVTEAETDEVQAQTPLADRLPGCNATDPDVELEDPAAPGQVPAGQAAAPVAASPSYTG